jgi:hypothetical protein
LSKTNAYTKTWDFDYKTEYSYSKVNTTGTSKTTDKKLDDVKMKLFNNSLQFSAPSISSLNIYNSIGQLILSIKQDPDCSLLLDESIFRSKITSGAYFAELTNLNGRSILPFLIRR